jgi:hypothetical protein
MGNLTITATTVKPVQVLEQFTGPAGEAIAAGQYVRYNTTSGKIELGNGSSAAEARKGGLALGSVGAGLPVTAVRRGIVDVGEALSGMAFDADVYLSDTDGTLATTAGTTSLVVGTVVPGWAATTADKLLRVDL